MSNKNEAKAEESVSMGMFSLLSLFQGTPVQDTTETLSTLDHFSDSKIS
jgi:hypothetical protein